MIIEELGKNIGKYAVLNLVPSTPDIYLFDFRKVKEIRKIEEVRDGVVWLGQGIIIDLSTKEIIAGTTESNSNIPMPPQEIYKIAGTEIEKIIAAHFENQDYFINGTIL